MGLLDGFTSADVAQRTSSQSFAVAEAYLGQNRLQRALRLQRSRFCLPAPCLRLRVGCTDAGQLAKSLCRKGVIANLASESEARSLLHCGKRDERRHERG